jgi:hypothetical protein
VTFSRPIVVALWETEILFSASKADDSLKAPGSALGNFDNAASTAFFEASSFGLASRSCVTSWPAGETSFDLIHSQIVLSSTVRRKPAF